MIGTKVSIIFFYFYGQIFSMNLSSGKKAVLLILLVLLIDQSLKFWVKTNMMLGQEYKVLGNWFIIHFTENNGMAFGMEFGGSFGKLVLSVFRIAAVFGIAWYLVYLSRTKAHIGYVLSIALILAGALGNIIDSVFYGILFDSSSFQVAHFLPVNGGYSTFLHGRVVDMLYFPLFQGHYPAWFPLVGSEEFIFFRPVFNIADSSIFLGVLSILIFQRKFFKHHIQTENSPA